jgi:hypothetical protein
MGKYLTAEQIYEIAEKKSETALGMRRVINKLFRKQDDSSLWPIRGKFDVTERAIRHALKFESQSGAMSPLEYAMFLESDTSTIVNDPKNQ